MNTRQAFQDMLSDAVKETGQDLAQSKEELSSYMNERALHLSTIIAEPGFDQAVIAERNNVAMRAGVVVSADGGALDNRWLGMIGGALRIAALALA